MNSTRAGRLSSRNPKMKILSPRDETRRRKRGKESKNRDIKKHLAERRKRPLQRSESDNNATTTALLLSLILAQSYQPTISKSCSEVGRSLILGFFAITKIKTRAGKYVTISYKVDTIKQLKNKQGSTTLINKPTFINFQAMIAKIYYL